MGRILGTRGTVSPGTARLAWGILLVFLLLFVLAAPEGVILAQERRLAYGETVGEILTANDPAHAWLFEGRRGDIITLAMNGVPDPDFTGLDPLLVLEFEDGTALAEDDDGGEDTNSRIAGFELPADGTYVVIATSFSGEGSGRYELSLDLEGRLARRLDYRGGIAYQDAVSAELTPEVMGHVWEFEGGAGDEIAIAMDALSEDLDPFLLLLQMDEAQLEMLFALDDEPLADLVAAADELGALRELNDDRDDSTNSLIAAYVLPADGRYFIVATSCCTGESSGPYELRLDLAPGPGATDPDGDVPDAGEPEVDEPEVDEPEQREPDVDEPFEPGDGDVAGPSFPLLPLILGGSVFLGLLFLVGMVAPAAWRRIRPPKQLTVPQDSPPAPTTVPQVRFEHKWDAGRQSIDPAGRPLKLGVEIRFKLVAGESEQTIDDESSPVG